MRRLKSDEKVPVFLVVVTVVLTPVLIGTVVIGGIFVMAQLPIALTFVISPLRWAVAPALLVTNLWGWGLTGLGVGMFLALLKRFGLGTNPSRSAMGNFLLARLSGANLVMGTTAVVVGAVIGLAVGTTGLAGVGSEVGGYSSDLIGSSGYALHTILDGWGGPGGFGLSGGPEGSLPELFGWIRLILIFLVVVLVVSALAASIVTGCAWLLVQGAVSGALQGGASMLGAQIIDRWDDNYWSMEQYLDNAISDGYVSDYSRDEMLAWFEEARAKGIRTPSELVMVYRQSGQQPPGYDRREILRRMNSSLDICGLDMVRKGFFREGVFTGALTGLIMALIGILTTAQHLPG